SNLFSNVSSCIRKKFLAHIPFNNDIVFAEDREWFIKVIKAGYTIVYEPNSIVYHSHNYSLKYNFKRAFDFGISSNKWEGQLNLENKISFFDLLFRFFNHIYRDYIFMKRNKISLKFKWLSYGAIWRFAIFIAQWLGAHYKYLPKTIRKKLSTAPQMFNKQ
ncbi:MAG: hypothetical protein HYU63_07970, partial [Armatimonadetes bacterium]|nr:hypothetical protein [Armatimonadota bacterium]